MTLAFSRDGRQLAASISTDAIRLFDGTPRPLAERARSVLADVASGLKWRDEILARLESETGLTPDVRAAAVELAKVQPVDYDALNDFCWEIVKRPGADRATYELALSRAERALYLDPTKTGVSLGDRRNTFVMALHRVGRYRESLDTLRKYDMAGPINNVIGILNRLRLGELDSARSDLARMQTLSLRAPDLLDLLAEATALSDSLRREQRRLAPLRVKG
jgi:hypothetical protein